MHLVSLGDIAWEEQHSPRQQFHSFARNVSLALGGIRNGGTWCGGHPFDVQIRRIPPGAAICPFHAHLAQWELFLVLSGTATVRVSGEDQIAAPAGTAFVHPPGEPHQLRNTSSSEVEVLIITDNPPLDAFHYPDSNKWGLRPPGKFFRMQEVGYFEGEEQPLPHAPPYRPSGSPAAPALPPFRQRMLHLDALAWEEFASPKRKFLGWSKEVSIALGAKRNTPTGLGDHPFDLELQKLAPGTSGCPFHSHALEWELFWIVSGTAHVRLADRMHTLHAGHIVLHPPGEAHQITNASATEDLTFWVIADNAPIDYWHYPDSQKWGLRRPRRFFRVAEADYWDGEE
jgi:uncharacterized cupin superfamily protein